MEIQLIDNISIDLYNVGHLFNVPMFNNVSLHLCGIDSGLILSWQGWGSFYAQSGRGQFFSL